MNRLIFLLFLLSAMQACSERSDHMPSSGAQDMAGTLGTFEFKPQDWIAGETTWWIDTDGIEPGIAGCHIGTHVDGSPNGRMGGEVCLADGLLVESDPDAGVLHSHVNDIGHPYKFDCAVWCMGNGYSAGRCEVAAAPPCEQSARCACN